MRWGAKEMRLLGNAPHHSEDGATCHFSETEIVTESETEKFANL